VKFKQSTIAEILDSEREMAYRAEERYGDYYRNAAGMIDLLNNGLIESIHGNRFVFALFLSQVKKHLVLALLSTARLHHVQAMMNLRLVLEAGACAAYAIANTSPDDFADVNADGTLDPSKKLTKKRYDWLSSKFAHGADAIQRMKDLINQIDTHANIATTGHNTKIDLEAGRFETPFFDYEDELFVKTDFWQIANIAMGLMDLFYGVAKEHGGLVIRRSFTDALLALERENERLKKEMMNNDRFRKYWS
jgi:hypothetical protein